LQSGVSARLSFGGLKQSIDSFDEGVGSRWTLQVVDDVVGVVEQDAIAALAASPPTTQPNWQRATFLAGPEAQLGPVEYWDLLSIALLRAGRGARLGSCEVTVGLRLRARVGVQADAKSRAAVPEIRVK
jgi:hypothetical protein